MRELQNPLSPAAATGDFIPSTKAILAHGAAKCAHAGIFYNATDRSHASVNFLLPNELGALRKFLVTHGTGVASTLQRHSRRPRLQQSSAARMPKNCYSGEPLKPMSIETKNIRLDYTDSDLQSRVSSFLASRYLPALRRLSVQASGGVVTLCGKVGSFYEKQVALNTCQRVAGVQRLIDAVEVA